MYCITLPVCFCGFEHSLYVPQTGSVRARQAVKDVLLIKGETEGQ